MLLLVVPVALFHRAKGGAAHPACNASSVLLSHDVEGIPWYLQDHVIMRRIFACLIVLAAHGS
jgi:hypothetical protein